MQPQERNHDSFSKTVMNSICQELVYRWVSNPVTASTEETFPLIINWRWQRRASVLAARWGRARGLEQASPPREHHKGPPSTLRSAE